jgi:hypothetical protein
MRPTCNYVISIVLNAPTKKAHCQLKHACKNFKNDTLPTNSLGCYQYFRVEDFVERQTMRFRNRKEVGKKVVLTYEINKFVGLDLI